jgi:hypothetical protein
MYENIYVQMNNLEARRAESLATAIGNWRFEISKGRLASTLPTGMPGQVAPPAGRGWRIEDGKWLSKKY